MVDFIGNDLYNTALPIKLTASIYLDGGTTTIPVSGVKTIMYNRPRKGKLILTTPPREHPDLVIIQQDFSAGNDDHAYGVIRVRRWNDASKTWVNDLTAEMTVGWYKISD